MYFELCKFEIFTKLANERAALHDDDDQSIFFLITLAKAPTDSFELRNIFVNGLFTPQQSCHGENSLY